LVGVGGKERGGALDELGRGAGAEQRASGHTQLLLAGLAPLTSLTVAGFWFLVSDVG
jgi:hypothetical protein